MGIIFNIESPEDMCDAMCDNNMPEHKAGKMKAYIASDRNGESGYSMVVFAETAGKAKAFASNSDRFDYYDFTDMRVRRCKELDSYYQGRLEMDWLDDNDRVAMVRYANFECSGEIWHPDCETVECPAQQWCGRYEVRNNG